MTFQEMADIVKHRGYAIIATLNIDNGWVDKPIVNPAYVFNNMKDLADYFNQLGKVEIVKEPNPNDIYDFGTVLLQHTHSKGLQKHCNFEYTIIYAKNWG
jgi:hypothetical protein